MLLMSTVHTYKAWFGDLGDGVHKGDVDDPRVSLIRVKPMSISYCILDKTRLGVMYEIAKGAVTGQIADAGKVREIRGEELQQLEGQH